MKIRIHILMSAAAASLAALPVIGAEEARAETLRSESGQSEKRELRVLSAPERERRVTHPRGPAGEMEKEVVAFLGVDTGPVSAAVATQLGLQRGTGLVVNHIVPKSPAASVLQQHDILLKLDDQILIETRQLSVLIRGKKEGDEVTLTYLRGGKQATVKVKLAKQELPKFATTIIGTPGAFTFAGPPERTDVFVPSAEAEREEVDRVLSLLQHARGIDLPPGHVPAAPRIRAERARGPGVRAISLNTGNSSLVYSDEEGSLDLRIQDGAKTLVAKDPQGRELYSGPVTTPKEREELPQGVRERLEKLEGMRDVTFRTEGDMRFESKVVRPRGIAFPLPAPTPRVAPLPRRMPAFF